MTNEGATVETGTEDGDGEDEDGGGDDDSLTPEDREAAAKQAAALKSFRRAKISTKVPVADEAQAVERPVSYTHLTLPTICSV